MPTIEFPLPGRLASIPFYAACRRPVELVPFWRNVIRELSAMGTHDYRLKVRPSADGTTFSVSASTGKEHKAGPRSFEYCLSCDPGVATIAENNFEGGEAVRGPPGGLPPHLRTLTSSACEWAEETGTRLPGVDAGLARVWLDAQARPLMIVTPRRHAGGMHEMTDAEVGALWEAVAATLALEARHSRSPPGQQPPQNFSDDVDSLVPASFSEVVLNVGRFRNIEHAHVKVWFEAVDFLDRVSRWPESKRALQADLQELRRLMKLPDEAVLLASLTSAAAGGGAGSETTTTSGGTSSESGVELLVRGVFSGEADASELRDRFGAYGTVTSVSLSDPRFGQEGAVVTLVDSAAAVAAVAALNLTRIGSNVMCKVKLAAVLLEQRGRRPATGPVVTVPQAGRAAAASSVA